MPGEAQVFFRTQPDMPAGPNRRAVDEALDGKTLTGFDVVAAEVAREAAEVADAARSGQDPQLWLSASSRLLGALQRLSKGVTTNDGTGNGDDDGMADLLGAGPTVGDPEDT